MNINRLSDLELESVCAGKSRVNAVLNSAEDAMRAHAQAMRTLESQGSELLQNANHLLKG